MTLIQNFEQTFFNDYSLLKQTYKRFKHRASQGFKILKEVDCQNQSADLLRRSVYKTVDSVFNVFRASTKKKFQEQFEINQLTLKQYHEGINELKKYEVHPALKKDGKQVLMDFYYDEA